LTIVLIRTHNLPLNVKAKNWKESTMSRLSHQLLDSYSQAELDDLFRIEWARQFIFHLRSVRHQIDGVDAVLTNLELRCEQSPCSQSYQHRSESLTSLSLYSSRNSPRLRSVVLTEKASSSPCLKSEVRFSVNLAHVQEATAAANSKGSCRDARDAGWWRLEVSQLRRKSATTPPIRVG
jgi:hypothetical protein